MPRYVDAHSHLPFPQYDKDRADALARMRERGIWTITVGTDLEHSRAAVEFAETHEGLFATAGLHPNSTGKEQFDEKAYTSLVTSEKVVGVGECGLDYYRNDPGDTSVKKTQHEQFRAQVEFSLAHDLPLMLHCRPSQGAMDAYEDTLSILEKFPGARGNVHFFVGDTDVTRRFLELGFTVSFTGVVTFARDYDDTIRYVPLSSMLTETDAPFAAPAPHRGKRNEPAYVTEVVRAIAEIRGEDEEYVREKTVENARRVFGLSV